MTNLIRFHEWIIDKDEIVQVSVRPSDGSENIYGEYDRVEHSVLIFFKNNPDINLKCDSRWEACEELDYLTASINCETAGPIYRHYQIKHIHKMRSSIMQLTTEIKKLMRENKRLKKNNA